MNKSIAWYNDHAKGLAARYESLNPERLNHWLVDLLPVGKGIVLDVGAGAGRDAAWLAAQGARVHNTHVRPGEMP